MPLTVEQILALAPDAASAKAGSQQASIAKWSGLGANDQALWGLCQGSGKDPYRAQIELAEPAFKCSCPSRKFPCKHGLGLYLIYARHAASFVDTEAPQWVRDWLQSRNQRAEKKAVKQSEDAAPPSEEELAAKARSQQKRQEKRSSNVEQGLDVLDTWLADIAREGLAGMKAKSTQTWEAMAARMVDSQAPGLATRVRRAAALIHATTQADWELPVARELARLALLTQSYRRLPQLPAGLQADVKNAVGWVVNQEDALAQPGLDDTWQCVGNHTQHEDRVSWRACYYRGATSRRWAMLMQFSGGNQPLPPPPVPGTILRGNVHYYPSSAPLRAVFSADVRALNSAEIGAHVPPAMATEGLDAQLSGYAQALAENPFVEQLPFQLGAVVPQHVDGLLVLRDNDGKAIPVRPVFQHAWRLLALAGGMRVDIFGLWDGYDLLPLRVTVGAQSYSLEQELPA
jgi:hypothetical protein